MNRYMQIQARLAELLEEFPLYVEDDNKVVASSMRHIAATLHSQFASDAKPFYDIMYYCAELVDAGIDTALVVAELAAVEVRVDVNAPPPKAAR